MAEHPELNDDELIAEVLRAESRGVVSRVFGAALSIFSLLAILGLLGATFLQVRQIDARTQREAFHAHERQIELQQILDSIRLVQAISAEQQLAGREGGAACAPAGTIAASILAGEAIGARDGRCLRDAIEKLPAGPAKIAAIAARDIQALERSVAPLAASGDELRAKALFKSVEQLAGSAVPTDPAFSKMLLARLHTVVLGVSGANAGARESCKIVLDAPAAAIDALEVYSWQAECLRKLPDLAQPGQLGAKERFELAAAAVQRRAPSCQADGGPGRTFAVRASRIFNGLGMTVVARDGDLDDARKAILEAVCYREQALQTAAQVAGSQENLALIEYRRFYASGEKQHLEAARCEAEKALKSSNNLPWSWTILYISERYNVSCEGVSAYGLREIETQLSFFAPDSFDREELKKLLPLRADVPGDTKTIDTLLSTFEEKHRAFDTQLKNWQRTGGGFLGLFGRS